MTRLPDKLANTSDATTGSVSVIELSSFSVYTHTHARNTRMHKHTHDSRMQACTHAHTHIQMAIIVRSGDSVTGLNCTYCKILRNTE